MVKGIYFLFLVIRILTIVSVIGMHLINTDIVQCKIPFVENLSLLNRILTHLWSRCGTTVLVIHHIVQTLTCNFSTGLTH